MRVKQITSIKIDTNDTKLIYTPESKLKQALTDELKDRYVGTNYKRMFVEDIEILRYGPWISENHRSGGFCSNDIEFVIIGVRYDKYEIIPDAKVVDIEDNAFVLKSGRVSMWMTDEDNLQFVRTDDVIPVMVMESWYQPYKSDISVTVIPLMPIFRINDVYKVYIDSDEKNIYWKELQEIKSESGSGDIAKKLYPYKKEQKHKKLVSPIDILTEGGSWEISYPSSIMVGTEKIIAKKIDEQNLPNGNDLLDSYIRIMIKDKIAINKMININYHKSIWTLYNQRKK